MEDVEKFIESLSEKLNDEVFSYIYRTLEQNPKIREHLNPAFPFPKILRIGILEKHLVIEYVGPNNESEDSYLTQGVYQPEWDIFKFLDIDLSHLSIPTIPVFSNLENMSFFNGKSVEYLMDYFYDITKLPFDFLTMNGMFDLNTIQEPTFISNTTFFWTDEFDHLKIRHLDFVEIIPLDEEGNVYYHSDEFIAEFGKFIVSYPVPNFDSNAHHQLNSFIELINKSETIETDITSFLDKNSVILQLAFGANKLNSETLLEWQYETDLDNLKPDFLPERMDGYCDILEFKLPYLKSKPIVGKSERSHPSYEIDTAIAQIDTYEEWCSQKVNTTWLEETKGIKILHPRRILVIGHSKEFSKEERAKLRATRNTTVFTYDEFIELVRYQLYRIK
jgi:hypothetical protein